MARRGDLVAFLPLMFLLGAMLAGTCEQVATRRRRPPFALPVAIEAVVLALLSLVIVWQDAHSRGALAWRAAGVYAATGLGSLAMGLQNATITRISGATVRTTHLTGVVTDLGTELAAILVRRTDGSRRPRRAWRRLARRLATRRLLPLAAIAGSFVYETFPQVALVPPALLLLGLVRAARDARGAGATRDVAA